MKISLSRDISLVIIVTVFFVSLLYSLLILLYSWTIEDNIFNRLVSAEAAAISEQYKNTGTIVAPKASYMQLVEDFDALPREIQAEYPTNPKKIEYNMASGNTMHLTTIGLNQKHYFLLADVGKFEVSKDNLPNLLVWLLLFACLTSAAALFVSLTIAKKITKPLKHLTQSLRAGAIDNINANKYPDNEIGYLAEQTKQSFVQLNDALKRESVFTKDVSHEIRTPLSVIQNIVTANRQHKIINASEFQKLDSAASSIRQITEILLALARAESSKSENVNITVILESVILDYFDLYMAQAGKNLQLDINIQNDAIVMCNKNLAQILVSNLLSNMVRHASGSEALIYIDCEKMIFQNEADRAIVTDILDSGSKDADSCGLGHGLNLIQRICEQSNWLLRVEQEATLFTVTINFHENSA